MHGAAARNSLPSRRSAARRAQRLDRGRSRCRRARSSTRRRPTTTRTTNKWDLARARGRPRGHEDRVAVKAEEARLKAAGEWDADEVNARASKTADGVAVIVTREEEEAAVAGVRARRRRFCASVADAGHAPTPPAADAAPAAAAAAAGHDDDDGRRRPSGRRARPTRKRQRATAGRRRRIAARGQRRRTPGMRDTPRARYESSSLARRRWPHVCAHRRAAQARGVSGRRLRGRPRARATAEVRGGAAAHASTSASGSTHAAKTTRGGARSWWATPRRGCRRRGLALVLVPARRAHAPVQTERSADRPDAPRVGRVPRRGGAGAPAQREPRRALGLVNRAEDNERRGGSPATRARASRGDAAHRRRRPKSSRSCSPKRRTSS